MEKLRQMFSSIPLWHLLVIGAIYYIAYQSFAVLPPRLEEHRKAKYHLVNGCIFCTVAQVLFMFALSGHHSKVPLLLRLSAFLTWTCTLAVILSNSDVAISSRHGSGFSAVIRRLSIVFICAAPV